MVRPWLGRIMLDSSSQTFRAAVTLEILEQTKTIPCLSNDVTERICYGALARSHMSIGLEPLRSEKVLKIIIGTPRSLDFFDFNALLLCMLLCK